MECDVLIIGGGIAGLSCAAFIGSDLSTVVLEAEPTLGYHATGRSAALYTECYGSGPIPDLVRASRDFLTDPTHAVLSPRGSLFVASTHGAESLGALYRRYAASVPDLAQLDSEAVATLCPILPASSVAGGVYEPRAADIDVDRLLGTFVAMARTNGVAVIADSRVKSIERLANGWRVGTDTDQYSATTVVNAAGAWGDDVAALAGLPPLGLRPLARSIFTFDPGRDPHGWPMVIDADEQWYFKPEGPHLLGSAASEIPTEPGDVRASELDVALGIERVTTVTTLSIRSVKNTWAGLRTFTPDRLPAVGRSTVDASFVWLVGQGGYGIKTSPALGRWSATLVRGGTATEAAERVGIDPKVLDPVRFG